MKNDYALLKVNLLETVPAYEFSKLASLINDIYDTFVFIETVKKSDGRVDTYIHPTEEERLYISRADIGTPNVIEFFGIAEHLIDAAKFLSENYNGMLSLGSATLFTIDKSNSIIDFMKNVKSIFGKGVAVETKTVELPEGKILEEELTYLEHSHKLSIETAQDKQYYTDYVRNVSHVSENIILNAKIIVVKSA